jgi:signal transduction histidine kinase
VPDPLRSHVDLRRDAGDRIVRLFVGARAWGAPVLGAVALAIAFVDPTPWRRATLLAIAAIIVPFSILERLRLGRYGHLSFPASADLLFGVFAQLVLVFATGGLGSPFAPPALLLAFLYGFLSRGRRQAWLVSVLQVPAVWLMAVAHVEGWLPRAVPPLLAGHLAPAGSGVGPYVYAAVLTVPLLLAPQVARRIRERLDDTYLRAVTARDRSLALYQDQAETLTRLSGEIAHELKNPLASIKGLGALLAKDAAGRDGERLAVLRREADRMQRILDEMLAYGRPLVPLAPDAVDLGGLAREVVTVHEGIAAARQVTVEARTDGPAPACCDPRKVLQVLTNLLQNALDAAPPGGRVTIVTAPGRIRVIDDGPGVPAAVGDRAFEAGVSSKARGTGLGLTIARTLARQHGGELRLGPRSDGRRGAEAVVQLPRSASALPPAPTDAVRGSHPSALRGIIDDAAATG